MKLKSQGFSLVEVLIAVTLFSIFLATYYSTRSTALLQSRRIREEVVLQRLCSEKLNEVILSPPELSEILTVADQTESIATKGFEGYQSIVQWKKLTIPDFSALITGEEGEEQNPRSALQKQVFDQLRDNIEKMVWQVKVTVKNPKSNYTYSLSTWVTNENAQVQIRL